MSHWLYISIYPFLGVKSLTSGSWSHWLYISISFSALNQTKPLSLGLPVKAILQEITTQNIKKETRDYSYPSDKPTSFLCSVEGVSKVGSLGSSRDIATLRFNQLRVAFTSQFNLVVKAKRLNYSLRTVAKGLANRVNSN